MMKTLYKIWSRSRTSKCMILIDDEDENKYNSIISQASVKLNVNGSELVLEMDGTPIEEEFIEYVKDQTLILLEPSSQWVPQNDENSDRSIATITTITNSSMTSDVSDNNVIIDFANDCNAEFFWNNFSIPWEILSKEDHEKLITGHCPIKIKTKLVHGVVDKMREFKKYIPSKAFKAICSQIIRKYPVLRDQDEDGVIIGDGYHSLFSKLQERNNYLNRPHKRISNENVVSPITCKKKHLSARAGCSNWAPNIPETEETDNIEPNLTFENSFEKLMTTSYAQQRKFLNASPPPSITKIREEWPILTSFRGIKWHFEKLTKSNLNSFDNIEEKCNKIIKILSKTDQNLNENMTVEMLMIYLLAKHFKEDVGEIFTISENEETTISIPDTPFIRIVIRKDSVFDFFVYLQQEKLSNEPLHDFKEAFKSSFALFYICNLKYPDTCSCVMEFIQRYVFKIHPDSGSKSKRQSKKKVLNLLNKLV